MFYPNVVINNADVIAITETWLREDVLNSEYFSTNFHVYRVNSKSRGRGILLAVKSHFISKQLPLTSPVPQADLIGISVYLNNHFGLKIINLYISPSSSSECY